MRRVTRRIAALARFLHIDPRVSGGFGIEQRTVNSAVATDSGSEEIPVVHRLAIIYLMLPVVIWLVGWFDWWLGVPTAVLLVLALWEALSGSWKVSLRPAAIVVALIALVWVAFTAASGIFDIQNPDWVKHRAIFLDLARGAWPVYLPLWAPKLTAYLPGDVDLSLGFLRYYLGYYIVPGLFGKWFGVAALNLAVPLWTWSGVALLSLMFVRGLRGWGVLAASLILIFFSGMDVVTPEHFTGWEWPTFGFGLDTPNGWPRVRLGSDPHLGIYYRWNMAILYVSNMIGLMWIPQHFIASGLLALLIVQLRRQRRFLAVSGVVVGGSLFWSPLVAVGLLPLVAVLVIENGFRAFLRWQNLLFSLPLVVLLLAYLTSGAEEMRQGWLLENTALEYVMRALPAEYLIEFMLLTVLLVLLQPRLLREPFFLAAIAVLLLLPWYSFGRHNDLVNRGIMPGLLVLSYFCARALLGQWPSPVRRGREFGRTVLVGLIVAILGVGAYGGLVNLARANNDHDFGVYRYTQFGLDYGISRAVPSSLVIQYLTYDVPKWFRVILRDGSTAPAPGKDELIAQSVYEVYLLEGGIVVYVKSPCTQDDVDARFILHVYPFEQGPNRHDTLDFSFAQGTGVRIGDTCLTSRALPSYAVGRLTVGQHKKDRSGHSWLRHYFSDAYRDRLLAEAGEPIIRSDYDIYLHREKAGESAGQPNRLRLLYFKPACSQEDYGTRFFMHVIPRSAEDLPDDRKEAGYEELNFALEDYGGRYGGDCFAVRDLPEYDILEIRTGQTTGENSNSWQGSFTLGN